MKSSCVNIVGCHNSWQSAVLWRQWDLKYGRVTAFNPWEGLLQSAVINILNKQMCHLLWCSCVSSIWHQIKLWQISTQRHPPLFSGHLQNLWPEASTCPDPVSLSEPTWQMGRRFHLSTSSSMTDRYKNDTHRGKQTKIPGNRCSAGPCVGQNSLHWGAKWSR